MNTDNQENNVEVTNTEDTRQEHNEYQGPSIETILMTMIIGLVLVFTGVMAWLGVVLLVVAGTMNESYKEATGVEHTAVDTTRNIILTITVGIFVAIFLLFMLII